MPCLMCVCSVLAVFVCPLTFCDGRACIIISQDLSEKPFPSLKISANSRLACIVHNYILVILHRIKINQI
jgi:hypothetical protein